MSSRSPPSTGRRTIASTSRPGRTYDLEWRDVDEDRGLIALERAVWHGAVDATKTNGPREIALTDRMRALLDEHRRMQVAGEQPVSDKGLIFPSMRGGFRGPESLHKPLRRAALAVGLDVRVGPQVLRRTFNTLMVDAGVDRIVLRSQMGHSSEEMTELYSGVPIEPKLRAVTALEALATKGREDAEDPG